MELKETMILIDKEIVTPKLIYCTYNKLKNLYNIKFKNSQKIFNYSINRVDVLTSPLKLDINMLQFYHKGILLKDVVDVYKFILFDRNYYHVCYKSGVEKDFYDSDLTVLESALSNDKSKKVFNYLKDVADATSIKTKEGLNLLGKQYEKIRFIDNNSVLANYLNSSKNTLKEDRNAIIFPFGCNLSQYNAVKNAICNKVSIIEGPPGTGKTQTILNIVANLIIRDKTSQIVSNNNSAIENVEEKLKSYDLDFFVALLGSRQNKESFVQNQKVIPDLSKYKENDLNELQTKINELNLTIKTIYENEKELSTLKQKLYNTNLEYEYFKNYIKENDIKLLDFMYSSSDKISTVWTEITTIENISFFNKLKYILIYRIGNFKFYNNNCEDVINSLQEKIYSARIDEIKNRIKIIEEYLETNGHFKEKYIELSMCYFKNYLSNKYKTNRKIYDIKNIRKNYEEFLKDYPVVLSTTYSSRNSFNNEVKFDYIIMDESSQIDVATGALSLSSASNAVIIGDNKQLPNVIPLKEKVMVDKIFNKYRIDDYYSYSKNSFLNSIKNIINDIPSTLLKEHYRCHPKIINFCNQKFYNNELIIMTKDNNEKDVIKAIRSNVGNHSRDKASERQIDILKDLLPSIKYSDIGVIAPYNNQVNLIRKELPDIEVNTIHKFQGREKDVIIISTVDDVISDFVDDENILNVAISRAKKQLFLIVTGNNINNTNINDFLDYINYNNFEIIDSKIYSVFDLLYKQYTEKRIEYLKKHKTVSKYDSENLMFLLIKDVIKNYKNLDVIFNQSLNMLLKDKTILTEEEKKYASNYLTHLDFLIYNELTKKPVLAVEVDGYKFHKNGSNQIDRDELKNSILHKYDLPLIRFKTTGSNEEQLLKDKLNEILRKEKV